MTANPIFPPDRLWTIKEAAYALGMSEDTARPLLAELAIRFSKRCVRYDPADVLALVHELKGAPQRRPSPADALDGFGIDLVTIEEVA